MLTYRCNDLCGDDFSCPPAWTRNTQIDQMTMQKKRGDIERIDFLKNGSKVIPLKHINKINKQGIHLGGKLYFDRDPKKYIDPENMDLDSLVSSLTLGHLKYIVWVLQKHANSG